MSEFRVVKYKDMELENPTVIIGFPTIGLVGSILASYLTKEKNMKIIYGMTSPDLPPYALIHDCKPYPPIRFYGHKAEAEEDKDLVVITSEVAPKPEICHDMVLEIFKILNEMYVGDIFCLEGVAEFEGAETVICGSSDRLLEKGKELGMVGLTDGLVRGITGITLFEGDRNNRDVLAILCPANASMPDPRASAGLIEPLNTLIPGLNLESESLFKEADEMENRIRMEVENEMKDDDIQQLYG